MNKQDPNHPTPEIEKAKPEHAKLWNNIEGSGWRKSRSGTNAPNQVELRNSKINPRVTRSSTDTEELMHEMPNTGNNSLE